MLCAQVKSLPVWWSLGEGICGFERGLRGPLIVYSGQEGVVSAVRGR